MKYADRVFQTSNTTGTGTYTLAAGPPGFRTAVAALGSGVEATYHIDDGENWETIIGVAASGTPDTLTRQEVLASSNGGAAVSWPANTKNIRLIYPGTLAVSLDKNRAFTEGFAASGGTGNAHTATLDPPLTGYSNGMVICYFAPAGNTGAVTLNINGLGTKALTKQGEALVSGDIPVGALIVARYKASENKFYLVGAPPGEIARASVQNRWIYGLTMANNAIDAANDLDFAAGACVSDDGTTIIRPPARTKRLDDVFTPGNNQGMLDIGSVSNTTYHLYAISKDGGLDPDYLASLSPSSPTLPAGYTKKRVIGSLRRASGALPGFVQIGRTFYLSTPVSFINTASSSTSAALVDCGVPSGAKFIAEIAAIFDGSSGVLQGLRFSDPDQPAITPSIANVTVNVVSGASASGGGGMLRVPTNNASQLRWAATQASRPAYAALHGWEDPRL